ncbi:MAG: ribose 5-phosphate isomerase B [Ruminococcaceae bacterium]|nr:ribose 5-phosphate isomerase B [Oscillospiraceae bacterium]
MKIAIGNDHMAVDMKNHIKKYLEDKGHTIVNFGTDTPDRTDYPIYAKKVADSVVSKECELGILICGTGIGISIAANKVKGIRAAVCSEPYSAALTRQHNNANIIAFGAKVIGTATAETIVDAFINAEYEGGRHARRVDMISDIEEGKFNV